LNTAKQIDRLWTQFQGFIESAYKTKTEEADILRDYQPESMHDELGKLLDRETAHERGHRKGFAPSGFHAPISAPTAAKLILMNSAVNGSQQKTVPPATIFLRWRDTAAEAHVIGYLIRKQVRADWTKEVQSLDYAQIMKAA